MNTGTVFHRRPAGSRRGTTTAAFVAGLVLFLGPAGAGEEGKKESGFEIPAVRRAGATPYVEQGGVRVALGFQPLAVADPGATIKARLASGEELLASFQVTDAGTGVPLRGLRPAAWLQPRDPGAKSPTGKECKELIRKFTSGALTTAAEIDLNRFYLFTLNADNSITVINPLVSFSRTKIIGIMTLSAPAADWALSPARAEILATLPSVGRVARIDTRRRRIVEEIEIGGHPGRILLLDEGRRALIGDEEAGSVRFLDLEGRPVPAPIQVGTGRILLAATRDRTRVFAASDNRLVVLDGRTGAPAGSAVLAARPTAMAVSDLAGAVFVASEESGRIGVHDAETGARRTEIPLQKGLSDVAITPDGRWGLASNRLSGAVAVFDASTGIPSRVIDAEPGAERIFFSREYAYVRSKDSANVSLLQWPKIASPGEVPVVKVPMGQTAPGEGTAAAPLEEIPGGGAVIAANRADRLLYYYGEGMMAPMGSFQNSSREPIAVKIVDESLKERAPGYYATSLTLEEGGTYDVPFLLDSPRIAGCFEISVEDSPGQRPKRSGPPVTATLLEPGEPIQAGRSVRLAFRLVDPENGRPLVGLKDVGILAFQPPGLFQARLDAVDAGDGVYTAPVTFPEPGEYRVLASCPSRGAELGDLGDTKIVVTGAAAGKPSAGEARP